MKKLQVLLIVCAVAFSSCAHHKLETVKTRYEAARLAQEEGRDLEALLQWKEIVKETSRQIEAGQLLSTNYFLRASAQIELGRWDLAFADLQKLQPQNLSKEEFWIYPLYLVLMGDYYAQQELNSVAQNFYQSVLKKSSLKSSPVYLLALERSVNNTIQSIEKKAGSLPDPEKFKLKEYESLSKDVEKYIEDYPFSSVSHFLLADLLLKTGNSERSMEHFLASLEMGLPTSDLKKSAEFQISNLLLQHQISESLRTVLLERAQNWWGPDSGSILKAGENTISWLLLQGIQINDVQSQDAKVRYLGIASGDRLKILIWEKR